MGYIKRQSDQSKSPAILDSSQYLFPNTGYQPFHVHSSQLWGANGETLLLPSIRSVKFEPSFYNTASDHTAPPIRKSQKQKITSIPNSLYFNPLQVELAATQKKNVEKLLATHFVIPVRLYKQNKQHYIEKNNPQEYKIKGYKIVGDIDHFYGKTKLNKTANVNKIQNSPKYHLFFLPEEVVAKNSFKDIKASDDASKENTSREEKLAHRPYKIQTNTQTSTNGSAVNATSSSQIVKKRLVPKKGANTNSVITASSSTVIKLPSSNGGNSQQQQHQSQSQTQQQHQQLQQHFQKPVASQQITQIMQPPEAISSYTSLNSNQATKPGINQIIKNPLRPLLNLQSNNNNNGMKNRPLVELQNNINSINNATSNAIKTAFQNIFRLPFRQTETASPLASTEIPSADIMPLPMLPSQPQQQQFFTAPTPPITQQVQSQPLYADENFQSDHIDSDYRWDDENVSMDASNSESQEGQNNSHETTEPEEKNIFSNLLKHKHETQKEALKQGGIIIQKLKVRKGGIAIAGPGGVATAGSGGTAIVGPGGYALTHPRSLTIAGPGAKVIAIPSNVDLKDALQRTNLDLQTFPREGRIVATGPTVYYAPPTGDYVDI